MESTFPRVKQPELPQLVALCGAAGSGKSEAASFLVRNYGFVPIKFAEPLKEMLRALFYFAGMEESGIYHMLEGHRKETAESLLCGRSPRLAMQTLGTEWGRDAIHPDLWVNIWKKRVNLQLAAGLRVVVDDLRFDNEFAAVRELGGSVLKISGPRRSTDASHRSELMSFSDDVDATIANNGTLQVLWGRVIDALT